MSLIFIGFVFFISYLVILYREDYIHGDYNINRFIYLVLLYILLNSLRKPVTVKELFSTVNH
jgi:NADH-Ubiquinone oxidoreductase (complex I), chain 5 N-terminus.